MRFMNMYQLEIWLEYHEEDTLGSGAQGTCFKIGNKVYKIFNEFCDEYRYDDIVYNKDDLLRFSEIKNNTFVWPSDVIVVGDKVVGYITDYIDAKSLYEINPLRVSLEKYIKSLDLVLDDIKIISDNGVMTFDVSYNTLYGRNGFNVIDTMEYTLSDIDCSSLYKINKSRFDCETKLFLIDGYFDEFIDNNFFLKV